MGFECANGDDVTNNRHLAEAIDMTREGSAPPHGSHGYDEVRNPDDNAVQTNRDSCFFVAIEELEKIDSAPEESQEEIDRVLEMLQRAQNAPVEEQARVMTQAHEILQDVWVPPTQDP